MEMMCGIDYSRLTSNPGLNFFPRDLWTCYCFLVSTLPAVTMCSGNESLLILMLGKTSFHGWTNPKFRYF